MTTLNDWQPASPWTSQSATQLARHLAQGDVTASEVVEAHIRRIEQVDRDVHALVVPRFEQAREEAASADRARQAGERLGPLHGVPITIKECLDLQGTPTTMGLATRAHGQATHDAVVVQALRRAGAIVLGKTNVPQLMLYHESENPLYGSTLNPWQLSRTSGGSTGGEAALLAVGGTPLGVGTDMGGSIRVPAHFCGVHGLKPTSRRLSLLGLATSLPGMQAIGIQPGPMARSVEDLELMLRVLLDDVATGSDPKVAPVPMRPASVPSHTPGALPGMRIGVWSGESMFPVAPAIRRALREAAHHLEKAGAIVEDFHPSDVEAAVEVYVRLAGADGGDGIRELLQGNELAAGVERMRRMAAFPSWTRPLLSALAAARGEVHLSHFLRWTQRQSAAHYWKWSARQSELKNGFYRQWQSRAWDAVICPPYALPAIPHGTGVDLLVAASCTLLINLVDAPAGVVAATRVREGEESDRPESRDGVDRRARRAEKGSAGLPVGVQVVALPWREDRVLAVMVELERAFRTQPDYPATPLTCHPARPRV